MLCQLVYLLLPKTKPLFRAKTVMQKNSLKRRALSDSSNPFF